MKAFLYGRQGAGKSTLIRGVVQRLGVTPAGFLTIRRPNGARGRPLPVPGVIKALPDPFLHRVRAHPDVVCVEVTEANRDALPGRLADTLRAGAHNAALPQNNAHAF
jgi:nucleoside-triphosphatase THEP1